MNSGLAGRTWADFRFQARPALGFQLLVHLSAFALGGPLMAWIGRHLVLAAGEPVVSNFDIAGFLFSARGIISVLIFAALAGAALLAELTGQSWIAGHAIARRRVTLSATVAAVLFRVPALLVLSARIFVRLVVLALPFLAAVFLVWHTYLRYHDINYYLSAHPPEWHRALAWGLALGAGYALVVTWQLTRWVLAVPILLYERTSPMGALAESVRRTRGHLVRILVPLVLWWCLLFIVAAALTAGAHSLESALMEWAGLNFARVLPLIALFLTLGVTGAFLHSALLVAGNQFLVTRMYVEQLDAQRWQGLIASGEEGEGVRRLGASFVTATAVLVALGLGVVGAPQVRHDDVGGLGRRDARVQHLDQQHGQHAPERLGADEPRSRRGGDARERVREHAPDGDGGIGEAGRAGEEVGGSYVGTDRSWHHGVSAGADQTADDRDQPGGGHHLGQEVGAAGPVVG